ncbi:MAG: DNA mismatch repair endonuclease MutL [Lachnospiraceae bacterium]|nr:DNA mismatch repair endonuclease MutL [Lachnospiraceae bacterium]
MIRVLDKQTIDQIAAGEVVERPSSIVKELVENAIDAGADAISVEIKNGGIDLVRVTDNGSGIEKDEVRTAFLRHATSKIETAEDLSAITSMGFRGEALSSIAAVTQLEVITKRHEDLSATDYEIHGGEEVRFDELGAPDGTTFLVRNIFYNTPARRKFLKTAMTEGSYVGDLMEKFALSHPDIAFRFIKNGQTVLATSGKGRLKDIIYSIYGRETANLLLDVQYQDELVHIYGYFGKPELSKGNRGFESYFVNGRYVKSRIIEKAIEDAADPFMMQHRYPFCVLYLELSPSEFDVNVHPKKMEIKFLKEANIYQAVLSAVRRSFEKKEFIQDVELSGEKKKPEEKKYPSIEPFETHRIEEAYAKTPGNAYQVRKPETAPGTVKPGSFVRDSTGELTEPVRTGGPVQPEKPALQVKPVLQEKPVRQEKPVQQDLIRDHFISAEGIKKHKLIGQLFDTYWLIQYEDELYIMDQHAAHEKVLYERKMKQYADKQVVSQQVSPPIMVTLSQREELILNRFMNAFSDLGYEISSFGGKEYAISAVPDDLFGLDMRSLFTEILSDLEEDFSEKDPQMILSKVASMSCKAAVKGNDSLSFAEADHLIAELLKLENPYACPHGRPTIIRISKTELEKRFHRIV